MTLDKYGAGCRCLLRSRENAGKPYIRDESFISARLTDFPDWEERPGAADAERLIALSRELGLSTGGRLTRDFADLVNTHAEGGTVLVWCDGLAGRLALAETSETVALLTSIDADSMTLWVPTPDGRSETLTIDRRQLDTWPRSFALVLTSHD